MFTMSSRHSNNLQGSPTCSKWPAGTYSQTKSSGCDCCPAGGYSIEGSSHCSPCPAEQYSISRQTSDKCLDCSAGTYSISGVDFFAKCDVVSIHWLDNLHAFHVLKVIFLV